MPQQTPSEHSELLRCFALPADDFEPVESHQRSFCLTAQHRSCARFVDATAAGEQAPAARGSSAATAPPLAGDQKEAGEPAAGGAGDSADDRSEVETPAAGGDPPLREPIAIGGTGSRFGIPGGEPPRAFRAPFSSQPRPEDLNWWALMIVAFVAGALLALFVVIVGQAAGGDDRAPLLLPIPTATAGAPSVAPAAPTGTPQGAVSPKPEAPAAATETAEPETVEPTAEPQPTAEAPAQPVEPPAATAVPPPPAPTADLSACNLTVSFAANPEAPQANKPFQITVTSTQSLGDVVLTRDGAPLASAGSAGNSWTFTDSVGAGVHIYLLSANGGPCGGTSVTVG